MLLPPSISAVLFALACGIVQSRGVVCPECLGHEDRHLNWCKFFRPLTGTDYTTALESQLSYQADWTIAAGIFAQDTHQGVESVITPITTSSLHPRDVCVCDICKKKCKNGLGLKIHLAKMHKNAISANITIAQAVSTPSTVTTSTLTSTLHLYKLRTTENRVTT